MPLDTSVLDCDAVALADLVRRKEVRPLELVDASIAAIESVGTDLNAVNTSMFELARQEAKAVSADAPFAGVPYLLKDIRVRYAGIPTSDGSALLRDRPAEFDSELVRRYKRAGLICLGKTNAPEFGLTATTEPRAFGPTRNPWDLGRTPGGSSGGAAAAVAARLVPLAHGSDGGGSIRIPASCCGVVGLKPTRGRNPLGPDYGDVMGGLVVEHVLTVSVRDCAALLDATASPDLGDPYWAPPPTRPFLQEVGAPPGALRIAVSTDGHVGSATAPECVQAVESATKVLESLGHRVEEAEPDYDVTAFRRAFTAIWFSNLAATLEGHVQAFGEQAVKSACEPSTLIYGVRGQRTSGAEYVGAVSVLQDIARTVARFFQRFDLWLTPTVATPPPPLGFLHPGPTDSDVRPFARRVKEFAPYTPLANATGQPAISLPLHWTDHDLPVGVHFTARFGDEATLLRLAAQLEEARPWRGRRPPVCAA